MTVSVRPLARADRDDWARMWRAYLAFYETERPQTIYELYFERLLGDDPRDFSGVIAELDGRPAGLTHFLFHRHGWSEEDVVYLQDLYCVPELRGRGVGRALIEAVYSIADSCGAAGVYWLTQDFNTTARRLYDRVGTLTPFVKYSRA